MLRQNPMRNKEYLEKYEKAKALYLEQQVSLTKAAEIAGIDRAALSRSLKEEGYKIINKQNLTKFDDSVFEKIDTEAKAYWLGFLYADGYVASESDRNAIELSLKSSDIGHLEKFRDFLGFDKTKHIYQDTIRYRLSFQNKKIKQNLIYLGCLPRKSEILIFPTQEQVPFKLVPDFIRGYIDGDGSVMINTRRTAGRLNILGTREILEGIVQSMGWRETKIRSKSEQTKVCSIEWSGYYVTDYLDQLYQNATVYLDRKYEKYLEIKALTNCRSSK